MDRSDATYNQRHPIPPVYAAGAETDESLAAVAATDPAAFAELYRRYVGRIYRYCDRRLRDQGLAEDATSQVFLKALESLQRKRIDNVASWLFSIAHNEVIDRYRRQRNDADYATLDLASPGDTPEDLAILQSEVSDVRRALVQLTSDQQRVIELRLAGLTTPEIQEVLGKGRSWVGTTQFRALLRLRALMRAPRGWEARP